MLVKNGRSMQPRVSICLAASLFDCLTSVFFHSQPQAEGNWFTDQRSSVICEETWLNHSILCVPLPTYVRAKNKKPRMEAKQGCSGGLEGFV